MILLNIGNTHTSVGVRDEAGKIGVEYFKTEDLAIQKFANNQLAVASVVPYWSDKLRQEGAFLISKDHAGGVDLSQIDSTTIGADRIANAIAAIHDYPKQNVIVVDFGTAINIEVVTHEGQLLGGAIMAGRKVTRQALHLHTAQLPDSGLSQKFEQRIGRNTIDALNLGVDSSVIGGVKEILSIIEDELKSPAIVVGIGGDVEFFKPHFKQMISGGVDFTLRGVALSWEYENSDAS